MIKNKSPKKQLSKDFLFNYLWRGVDPEGILTEQSSARSLPNLNLREQSIFDFSRSPLFKEVPVALAPYPLNSESLEPLWTFHEEAGSSTSKIRVSILDDSPPLITVDDLQELKELVSSSPDLSEDEKRQFGLEISNISEGSNRYLRLQSLQLSSLHKEIDTSAITLRCEPSDYSVGALAAVIKKLGSKANRIGDKLLNKSVNNLAIRVALVSISPKSFQARNKPYVDSEREIILHRRTTKVFTYNYAWDVSAAGYVHRLNHLSDHDERRIDLSKAARAELDEELGIPKALLPTEEQFVFFGLTQNLETGQTDVVGQVHVDKAKFDQICRKMNPDPLEVSEAQRVKLRPDEIARFLEKESFRMVPSAFCTILLCLRHAGFSATDIIAELRPSVDSMLLKRGFRAY
jgi:isopentenyldiphosphate isomerase